DVAAAWLVFERRPPGRRQASPEVGTAQVFGAVAGGAANMDRRPASCAQRFGERAEIERDMYRIARLGMVEHEPEALGRGLARAGAPEPDPRRRESPEAPNAADDGRRLIALR